MYMVYPKVILWTSIKKMVLDFFAKRWDGIKVEIE